MSISRSTLTALAFLCGFGPLQAQPVMVQKFDHWGVYSYKSEGQTVCYALTVPQQMKPEAVNHGSNYLMVAPRPDGSGAFSPQTHMGYALKGGSEVTVKVADKTFVMTPRGTTAWTQRESREAELVAAMKSGSDLTVEATSKRGTQTQYAFSLTGVTAALNQVSKCK